MELVSRRVEVEDSLEAIYDLAERQGWGDGLPVVPPTPARVEAMIQAAGESPERVVALLPPRGAAATIEKLAISAVMAGLTRVHFPIVVAAVEAAADPAFNLYGLNTTTSSVSPVLVVNGPSRDRLGIRYGYSCFGNNGRANATIGRAFRLAMLHIGGSVPGSVSKSVFGQPGRISMCTGEWEEKNPWEPIHVQKGFGRDEDVVTVEGTTGIQDIADIYSRSAEGYLMTIAHSIDWTGTNKMIADPAEGEMWIFLCPDWAEYIARGFSLAEAKRFLHDNTRPAVDRFPKEHLPEMERRNRIREGRVPLTASPDQFVIGVAGGTSGLHALALHSWGPSRSVSRRFGVRGEG